MAEMREPRLLRTIPLLLVTTLLCTAAGAGTIYVDDDAPEFGDGSSWETAYRYLQDALAEAEATEGPVEIRVAQGLYRPDRSSAHPDGTGDRKASFEIPAGTAVLGGYAGIGAPDSSDRDVTAYKTILSGDLAGNDLDVPDPCDLVGEPSRSENACNVVEIENVSGVRLDGVIISGGHANISVREQVAPTTYGAGLRAVRSDNLSIQDCSFTKNYASGGGGGASVDWSQNVTLAHCRFTQNSGGSSSGGLSVGESTATLSHCEISGNFGSNVGGMRVGDGEVTVSDSELSNNSAIYRGGGVSLIEGTANFVRCLIRGNSANTGAGVMGSGGDHTFAGCHFVDNHAGTYGGAIRFSGALTLSNCGFAGNSAQGGGAIACRVSIEGLLVDNCTSVGNRASDGCFLLCEYDSRVVNLGTVSVVDSIVADGRNAIVTENTSVSLDYSLVSDGPESIHDPNGNVMWGVGNLDGEPLFADPGYWDPNGTTDEPSDDFWVDGDYHLKSQAGRWDPATDNWVTDDITSPCIDAGDPNSPIGPEPFPNGGRINMGAYGGTVEASKSPSGLHAKYGGGAGEPNDPYLIYTAEHLNAIGTDPNDWDKHFKLMADIDLSGYSYDRAVIADAFEAPFTGFFDGNGHTISHLTIVGEHGLALFGGLGSGGAILNLRLEVVDVNGTGDLSAGVASWNGGDIANCHSAGRVTGRATVGGLVGENDGNISNSYSEGTVGGEAVGVGGLVGVNDAGSISTSSSSSECRGDYAGGLVGWNVGRIVASYSTGAVTGNVGSSG